MLFVITGPSGVGKTTIIERLLEAEPSLKYSVSLTTRSPRVGEIDGVHYCFVSSDEFHEKMEKDEFAEWSEVYGEQYGRLKKDLDALMERGDALVGIDVQGATKLCHEYPEGVFIFILPKSKAVLKKRLTDRKTDSEASIETRLDAALQELDQAGNFDHSVVNDDLDTAISEVRDILATERRRSDQNNKHEKAGVTTWKEPLL